MDDVGPGKEVTLDDLLAPVGGGGVVNLVAQSRGVLPLFEDVAAPGSEVITPVDDVAADEADDVAADDIAAVVAADNVVADDVVADDVVADNVAAADVAAADVAAADLAAADLAAADLAADDIAAEVVAADDVAAPESEEPDVAAPCREGRADDGAAWADRGGEVVRVLIVELVTASRNGACESEGCKRWGVSQK